ncbi:MAG: UDP-N-acetylglucosamine--LPS N-acetylglucosamine transferase [Gammaproteobacteria bacterium]|nr:UDP-N-acetylglucosamine--LPS N-acetylglucosamine transferase [Gammaproteobacteria bacterium]
MNKKKLLVVSSQGGHSVQLMRLKPVFDHYNTTYVSSQRRAGMKKYSQVIDANRNSKFHLILLSLQILFLVIIKRPDVIISSGAAPGYFAMLWGKLFGKKTIWLDSMANAEELSMSGEMAGKFADLWLTQWPEVAQASGPYFKGRVL